MGTRTSACVGKKLGCAYGFGVGDCVDMRCDATRLESDGGAGFPFFFFFFLLRCRRPTAGVNNK